METVEIQAFADLGFSVDDFGERWRKARVSAVLSVLNPKELTDHSLEEEILIKGLSESDQDLVLRRVFDYSRRLGVSTSKYFGVSWEISDFSEILPLLRIPCFSEKWRKHNSAQVLERKSCSSFFQVGSFGCDYWREALDGLVMGLGENERLTRHRSVGHGDSHCLDVLYVEEYDAVSATAVARADGLKAHSRSVKFGPIPEDVVESLRPIQKEFETMKVRLVLDGLSEGILYYRLDSAEGVLCGAAGKLMHDSLAKDFSKIHPTYRLKDSAPLAVYGGSS